MKNTKRPREPSYLRRKLTNVLVLSLSALASGLCFLVLGEILYHVLHRGLEFISWRTLTESTPPPGGEGGLANAIIGSVMITVTGTLMGAPIGLLAGTYLAEFDQESKIHHYIRFFNGILLSAPSIIIGFFIYSAVVMTIGHFSGWAGAFALALIQIPIICTQTENMLNLVPQSLREASAALGASQWKTTSSIVFASARTGLLTGLILSLARISGETAPLLFTALNNQFWSLNMNRAMANLPSVIFQFAMSPYEDWQNMAWSGALLITFVVLCLNVLARLLLRSRP